MSVKFTKKNAIHTFEDASSLEFFSEKNDTSLIVLGAHSKKRPHCLTFVRTFDYKILDMLELYLDPDSFRTLTQFKTPKPAIGLKPLILFSGTAFDSPTSTPYTLLRSILTDFFRGHETSTIDVEGLQYLVSVAAGEEGEGEKGPKVHLRVYLIRTKRSGQKLPRVEVEEMGPRMDFRLGRIKEADEDIMKEALRKAKGVEVSQALAGVAQISLLTMSQSKPKKNVETDIVGDKIGRIHLGRQDLGNLQTRKMKGLKRARRDEDEEDEGEAEEDDRVFIDDGEDAENDLDGQTKRPRLES